MDVSSRAAIAALLSSSLGSEAARAAVDREAAVLGFGNALTTLEGVELLHRLESGGGPAGLAARIVLQRLERSASGQSSGQFRPSSIPEAAIRVAEVQRLLAVGLGDKRAHDVLHQALALLGLSEDELSKADAVRVLDVIEETTPPAASVARFAKVRIHLKS
jgi:hypothetical protein